MAHSLSAKKRVRQNAKRRTINRARKTGLKTELKAVNTAITSGDKKASAEQYKSVVKKLDKIAAAKTIHKNRAARLKSRLAKKINKLKG
ncbi:MAG: 30S ribosomal protein S20 [Planctomycetes bacterium GWF2_41_51]|nr:MAG: 30S ribosomal protein S20 [Planctomycetes bacterium GWF2_41_51]HBG28484.1 30S ribosomal protein S20 [Phycisphaerales bacterium]